MFSMLAHVNHDVQWEGLDPHGRFMPCKQPKFKEGIDLKATNKETIDRVFTVT